ncbi:dual specificity protein phosphatase 22-A-like isoform X2 [Aquila chrysaetos chrysaetos]|uniref:dual specificity protein phosphatase 22-A-like isoform X2 n=1 Tax=Aquila chrysaetos chrysaetos TaxID=223781 RepID=UPI00117729C6|nr:dual specificity protein phosphatase 22-A-like isoform X2 [Aquila chrysaetos chrysaetos]
MGTGMSKVVKGLYLGNIRDSEDRENLLKNGVTHILSVHNSAKPVLEDMTYLCISASDSSSQNLLQHFKECIKFIHECRLGGGGCLVHCLAGVSRSTTVLVAYLMTVTELGWESCLAATKAVRSYVSPNFGFQQQLQEYEVTLLQEAAIWKRSAWEQTWIRAGQAAQEEKPHFLLVKTWEEHVGPSGDLLGTSSSGLRYRAWIRRDYGRNPFKDQEELQCLLARQEQRQKEQQLGSRDCSWLRSPAPTYPLPYHAGGTSRSRWMNR